MPKPSEDVIRSELTRLRNVYDKASAKNYGSLESLQDQVMDPLTSYLAFPRFISDRCRIIQRSETRHTRRTT